MIPTSPLAGTALVAPIASARATGDLLVVDLHWQGPDAGRLLRNWQSWSAEASEHLTSRVGFIPGEGADGDREGDGSRREARATLWVPLWDDPGAIRAHVTADRFEARVGAGLAPPARSVRRVDAGSRPW